MTRFLHRQPHLAKYWTDPEALNSLPTPMNTNIQYESWDLVAKRLMSSLWRVPHAKLFHSAVDPEGQNLPDYFEIIKNPIDFSLVRQRLHANLYHKMQEFVDDMQLVFDNCVAYNGRDSVQGRQCQKVRDEFLKLYEQLNVEFYII